jgi:8-oxo-dGTP diphosphatase
MKQFGSPQKNIFYLDRPSAYGIFVNKSGEIAVEEVFGRFFLPGGGIEKNETMFECLNREFLEELGWKIDIGDHLEKTISFICRVHDKKYFKIKGDFFQISHFQQISPPEEKNHVIRWMTPQNAIELLVSDAQRYIIKKYFT